MASKKKISEVEEAQIDPIPPRPDLTELSPEILKYIEYLEKTTEVLQSELDAKQIEGEAAGIAFADLWGLVTANDGGQVPLKVSITSRSRISASNAIDLLIFAARHAKEYNLHPYRPIPGLPIRPTQSSTEPRYEPLPDGEQPVSEKPVQSENMESIGP